MQEETAAWCVWICFLACDRVAISLEGRNVRNTGHQTKTWPAADPSQPDHLRPGRDEKLLALRRQSLNLACLWSRAWHTAEAPDRFADQPEWPWQSHSTAGWICCWHGWQRISPVPKSLGYWLGFLMQSVPRGKWGSVVWGSSCPLPRG